MDIVCDDKPWHIIEISVEEKNTIQNIEQCENQITICGQLSVKIIIHILFNAIRVVVPVLFMLL